MLAAFSNRVLRFGAVGSGTEYKLVINFMGAVQIAAAAEGMALAERAALDLRLMAEAIATSPGYGKALLESYSARAMQV